MDSSYQCMQEGIAKKEVAVQISSINSKLEGIPQMNKDEAYKIDKEMQTDLTSDYINQLESVINQKTAENKTHKETLAEKKLYWKVLLFKRNLNELLHWPSQLCDIVCFQCGGRAPQG